MKKEEILAKAALAAKNNREGDFFIGCKVDELLPNKNKSTLVCVDCSWLRNCDQVIIDRNDLDEVAEGNLSSIKVSTNFNELVFTKWIDMVDEDGDVHHCKIESFAEISDDIYYPVREDDLDWVVYIEV